MVFLDQNLLVWRKVEQSSYLIILFKLESVPIGNESANILEKLTFG